LNRDGTVTDALYITLAHIYGLAIGVYLGLGISAYNRAKRDAEQPTEQPTEQDPRNQHTVTLYRIGVN